MLDATIGLLTGFKAHEFVAHSGKTNCVAVGPRSGQVLATGGDDKRVNVWRIGRASSIWSLTGNSSAIESLRFDPTEDFLVSGSAGGAVKLFDLSAGKMMRHFRGHMSNVTVIDCGSFDRRFVATGSMDCQVKMWNVDTKECAMGFKGHSSEVTDVRFSPDGNILASAAADGQIKLWDLRAGKPMHTFQACTGPVRALRFNPQEFLLAASTSDRTVKLYDIEYMDLFCATAPDTSPTRAMTFDPDGQIIYCASPTGLRQWSWDNDTSTARLEAMGDMAWGKVGAGALHFNSDGRQLLAASCAGTRVSVWAVDLEDDRTPLMRRKHDQGNRDIVSPSQCSEASSDCATVKRRSSAVEQTAVTEAMVAAAAAEQGRLAMMPPSSDHRESSYGEDVAALSEQHSKRSGDGRAPGGRVVTDRSSHLGRAVENCPRNMQAKGERSTKSRATEASRAPVHVDTTIVETCSYPKLNRFGGDDYGDNGAGGLLCERQDGSAPSISSATDEGHGREAKRNDEDGTEARSGGMPAFLVLGRNISASPVADEKQTSSPPHSIREVASLVTRGSDTATVSATAAAATAAQSRRTSLTAAVAATVAAVASAKAATDDTVAAVACSGRHRSIGTSISDTLVMSVAGAGGAGASEARNGSKNEDGRRPASCSEPAPAKSDIIASAIRAADVSRASHRPVVDDRDFRWHKRVSGAFAGATGEMSRDVHAMEEAAQAKGEGVTFPASSAGSPGAAAGVVASPTSYADHGPCIATPSEGLREGGGDSPPLLGSTESSPLLFSRRPAAGKGSEASLSATPTSAAGFAQGDIGSGYGGRVGATAGAATGATTGAATPMVTVTGSRERGSDHPVEASGGGCGDDLGMTRPRTATRRWDRPGPPGDDEIITKTLLSRASVMSALSHRLAELRLLRSGWADGAISGTISRLKKLYAEATSADASQRTIVADFLWAAPLAGARVTLEHCLEFMPLLEDMWKAIVLRFGNFVRDTLRAPGAIGGVDLAREDRIGRCREAHRAFIRGYHHLERAEREFYEDARIAAVAGRLRPLFESYFAI